MFEKYAQRGAMGAPYNQSSARMPDRQSGPGIYRDDRGRAQPDTHRDNDPRRRGERQDNRRDDRHESHRDDRREEHRYVAPQREKQPPEPHQNHRDEAPAGIIKNIGEILGSVRNLAKEYEELIIAALVIILLLGDEDGTDLELILAIAFLYFNGWFR